MKSTEFKARQLWLGFIDRTGIALQIMSEIKEKTADWFNTWKREFRTVKTEKPQKQLSIDFLKWIFYKERKTA
jgi:hypothetical protein